MSQIYSGLCLDRNLSRLVHLSFAMSRLTRLWFVSLVSCLHRPIDLPMPMWASVPFDSSSVDEPLSPSISYSVVMDQIQFL